MKDLNWLQMFAGEEGGAGAGAGDFSAHFQGLEQQSQALRQEYPDFDLRRELQNPTFARVTAPDVNLGVAEAYYATHHSELRRSAMELAARQTAKMLGDAIRAGQYRPRENGGDQGATVSTFDYRTASPDQRKTLKKQIRAAAARGEKLYPTR